MFKFLRCISSPQTDRNVAMEFFQSLTGTQLLGTSQEQKERTQEIARLLKK